MTSTYLQSRYVPRRNRHGRTLVLHLTTASVVAFGLAFIVYVLWPRWPGPPLGPDAPALPITVAGTAFNVPPAAIRVTMQRQPGAQERLDLNFLWPSLSPPYPVAPPNAPTKAVPRPQSLERVFVTITMASDALPPEERVKSIYPRYTEAEPVPGPEGLVVLPFRPGTPYQGEDLIYDASTPARFLVRCSRNGAGGTPGICMQVRRIGEAEVTIRFPRDWLDDWRAVSNGIDKLIANLRPGS